MKTICLITGALLSTLTVLAQEPACDCADCLEKAAAAAAGKEFTLPGLQGLNERAGREEDHDHGQAAAPVPHGEHEHEKSAEPPVPSAHSEHDGCAHEGHDHDKETHDHSTETGEGIELADEAIETAGIQILEAGAGTVVRSVTFPAEMKLNRDRTASVSPRYPSVVRQVFAEIGDAVKEGDLLASLENRETLAVYPVAAPLDGVVIGKDVAVGEAAGGDDVLFEVADLSSVWADLSVFPQYRHLIRKGMEVTFTAHDGHTVLASIKYISPLVSNETRTFTARCVLEDAAEDFTPGSFVRARIVMDQTEAPVVVPPAAVQTIDGETIIFVAGDHGFTAAPVQTGRSDASGIEIRSGLKPGDRYVAAGAFALKAQMITSGMDPHAGHGH